MNHVNIGSIVAWAILLIVFVLLPAMLRRYQIRAGQRNRSGACGRCGSPLAPEGVAYMEGFRVCPSCAKTVRLRGLLGGGLIGLIMLVAIIGSFVAIGADARAGNPDPWWAYFIVAGLGVTLGGLVWFAVSKTRSANKRAA